MRFGMSERWIGSKVRKQIEVDLPDAELDELNSLLGDVDPNPLAAQPFGGHASGCATGEWIKNHIALVGTGLDDPLK